MLYIILNILHFNVIIILFKLDYLTPLADFLHVFQEKQRRKIKVDATRMKFLANCLQCTNSHTAPCVLLPLVLTDCIIVIGLVNHPILR